MFTFFAPPCHTQFLSTSIYLNLYGSCTEKCYITWKCIDQRLKIECYCDRDPFWLFCIKDAKSWQDI